MSGRRTGGGWGGAGAAREVARAAPAASEGTDKREDNEGGRRERTGSAKSMVVKTGHLWVGRETDSWQSDIPQGTGLTILTSRQEWDTGTVKHPSGEGSV